MATSTLIPSPAIRSPAAFSSSLSATQRQCFVVTLCIAALLPLVPDQLTIATVAFCLSFAALTLTATGRVSHSVFKTSAGLFLFGFFVMCLASLAVALNYGLTVSLWVRAIIPFTFLVCFFYLAPLNDRDALFVLNVLHGAALVWGVRILGQAWEELPLVLRGITPRLTYVTLDTLIPFGFLGLLLSLFNPSPWAVRWRVPLTLFFAFFVITCAYRSQILLSMIAMVVYVYRGSARTRLLAIVAGGAVLLLAVNWLGASFLETLVGRFEHAIETGLGAARQGEMAYAFERFRESPVWGNGLGHPVPLNVGHALDDYRWSDFDTVSYVHNVWLYLMMDVGAVGLLFYAGFFATVTKAGLVARAANGQRHPLRWCAAFTLLLLLAYTSCQAAFRNIQFNLMLAMLAAVALPPRHTPRRAKAISENATAAPRPASPPPRVRKVEPRIVPRRRREEQHA